MNNDKFPQYTTKAKESNIAVHSVLLLVYQARASTEGVCLCVCPA